MYFIYQEKWLVNILEPLVTKNIKMIIAYEGTNYAGFQRQKNGQTIQGTIETALQQLTGEKITLIGAGRTDAGVHAAGQAINFFTKTRIPTERLKPALNRIIPPDILIREVWEVSPTFHARYSAISKTYSYNIHTNYERPLFRRNFVYHYKYSLSLAEMKQAGRFLIGTHDFKCFQATGNQVKTTVRTINYCEITKKENEITITINADGFLYHMVRNIVGTLILVGNQRLSLSDFQRIMNQKDRSLAGPTAPACGLSLVEVFY